MNDPETRLDGHCLCGAVTISVDGLHEPSPGVCHCRMCQQWTGGALLAFRAAKEAVTVDGPVTRFASSAFAERAFCARCGSHLWMRDVDDETSGYDLMPGLFDAALGWPLRSEIYADRAMASLRLMGDHRRTTEAEYEAQNPHVTGED
jgi:hypothetical protein